MTPPGAKKRSAVHLGRGCKIFLRKNFKPDSVHTPRPWRWGRVPVRMLGAVPPALPNIPGYRQPIVWLRLRYLDTVFRLGIWRVLARGAAVPWWSASVHPCGRRVRAAPRGASLCWSCDSSAVLAHQTTAARTQKRTAAAVHADTLRANRARVMRPSGPIQGSWAPRGVSAPLPGGPISERA